MNALMGASLSIVTSKAQTTRHRIRGILNTEDYQLVFSDTPGIMEPSYKLHHRMLDAVRETFEDADLVLFVTEVKDRKLNPEVEQQISFSSAPLFVVLNKVDTADQQQVEEAVEFWKEKLKPKAIFPIAALHSFYTDVLLKEIINVIPEGPPYFEKTDDVSDRNMRFFTAEMIRERILNLYQKEIPYSVEIVVTSYKESPEIDRIYVTIFCERESQKAILLGHQGKAIKKLGIESRKKLEEFTGKKIHLELSIKVAGDWRNNERMLRDFGYE